VAGAPESGGLYYCEAPIEPSENSLDWMDTLAPQWRGVNR
jgi:hypothetical protein